MRILQIIETGGTGGAETVFVQLAGGLSRRGHDICCLTGPGGWVAAELGRRGIPCELRHEGGSLDIKLLAQIRGVIRAHRIELVHSHLFDGSVYATAAARMSCVPSVVTFHGQTDIKARSVITAIKSAVLRYGANGVVAVSGPLRDDLQSTLRIPDSQFVVIPNGLESVTAGVASTRREAVTSRGSGRFRMIAVGNIRPSKNYHAMLKSMSVLIEHGVDVQLDILGDPEVDWLYAELLALREDLGLTERVVFHGFVPDPFSLLSSADCFVLASSTEGFSLAIVEAMLAGVPIVATRCGGPEAIIADDHTGLLVPVGDWRTMAEAIKRIHDDENLAMRLRTAAQRESGKYSIGAMVSAYESLYQQLGVPRY